MAYLLSAQSVQQECRVSNSNIITQGRWKDNTTPQVLNELLLIGINYVAYSFQLFEGFIIKIYCSDLRLCQPPVIQEYPLHTYCRNPLTVTAPHPILFSPLLTHVVILSTCEQWHRGTWQQFTWDMFQDNNNSTKIGTGSQLNAPFCLSSWKKCIFVFPWNTYQI